MINQLMSIKPKAIMTYKAYCIKPVFGSWLGKGTSFRSFPVAVTGCSDDCKFEDDWGNVVDIRARCKVTADKLFPSVEPSILLTASLIMVDVPRHIDRKDVRSAGEIMMLT